MNHETHEIHEQIGKYDTHEQPKTYDAHQEQETYEIHEQNGKYDTHEQPKIYDAHQEQETYEIHEQPEKYEKILFKDECYGIQGAVFEVYRVMGCGFLEAVYQECLEIELKRQGIPFKSQIQLALTYKGERLIQIYKPDFICYGKIIVELKAVKDIGDDHRAQIFNYLKATGMRLGLLVNFGHYPKATIERIVL